jgi:aspartate/methionine/tyrosine aminotransferase
MREHPRPVVDLALGRDRLAPPGWLVEWLRDRAEHATRAASHEEVSELAEQAAAWLRRGYGAVVRPESILPAPGGRVAMNALISAVVEPGDGVVVTEPGYPVFAELVRHHGARVHAVDLDPARGFAPRFGDLSGQPATTTRLVALNYPNNPTGATFSSEVAGELDRVFGEAALVFNDAIYAPMELESQPVSLLGGGCGWRSGRPVVELYSLAKPFGLGPLGVSFLVGSESWIARVRRLGDFAWSPPSALQVQTATRCLGDDGHLEAMREDLRARIGRLRRVLTDLGFDPYPTPAGMYVLCPAPRAVGGQETATAHAAADLLLDRFDVAVAPWDGPPGYLRFAAMHRDEDLAALEGLVDELEISPAG